MKKEPGAIEHSDGLAVSKKALSKARNLKVSKSTNDKMSPEGYCNNLGPIMK